MAFKLGMAVDLCMAYIIYMLMLTSMTLTLMQGHSGLTDGKNQCSSQQLSKQYALN